MESAWNQEIPEYWADKGVTIEFLQMGYKITHIYLICFFIICIVNYVICWRTRKTIDPMKLIGEIPMTKFEKYAFACQLGREPSINFVNSTLVTNDRAYVLLRLILGLTSTISQTFVGASTPFRGVNYPIAVVLTIYTNFNRKKIILGFGSKMQTLNKIHTFLFNCQVLLTVFNAISNRTNWLGIFRYRDMSRKYDGVTPIMAMTKEFIPLILMLVELLWFDTKVSFWGCWHAIISTLMVLLLLFGGRKQYPQAVVAPVERPARSLPQIHLFIIAIPVLSAMLAGFCALKKLIFKKLPIIGDRIRNRENLIENFRKRQAFSAHFPATHGMKKRRTTTTNEIFKKFGRVSQKSSILRRIAKKRNIVAADNRTSRQSYGARRMSIAHKLLTVDSLETVTEYD